MASMRELIAQIDRNDALSSVEKGDALMKSLHPEDRLKGMHALAHLVFVLPREAATATHATGAPLQVVQQCPDCAARASAAARTAGPRNTTRHKTTSPTKAVAHASPRVLAARAAWNDWLETSILMPGTTERVAIGDMTTDQLQDVANALYDASLQLHALADAITEAGVDTARELTDEAAALVLEAAS